MSAVTPGRGSPRWTGGATAPHMWSQCLTPRSLARSLGSLQIPTLPPV
jgi:hypothetical protein